MDLSKRHDLRALRTAVEKALTDALPDLGFSVGSISFDPGGLKASMKLIVTQAGTDLKAEAWKQHATSHGLQVSDLGRTFKTWNGRTYTISGLNPRARKTPILADRFGKTYRFDAPQVRAHLALTKRKDSK